MSCYLGNRESHLCNSLWRNCSLIRVRHLSNIVIMLIFVTIIDKIRKFLDLTPRDGRDPIIYQKLAELCYWRTVLTIWRIEQNALKRCMPRTGRNVYALRKFRVQSGERAVMNFRRAISIPGRERMMTLTVVMTVATAVGSSVGKLIQCFLFAGHKF